MINITTRMLDKLPAECRQISIHRDREDVYIVTNAGIFVPHDGRLVLLPEGPAFGITVKYEKE